MLHGPIDGNGGFGFSIASKEGEDFGLLWKMDFNLKRFVTFDPTGAKTRLF